MVTPVISKKTASALLVLATVLLPVSAQAGSMGAEYFKNTDTNNDGALSKEEMAASRMQRLGAADTDKDGFISASELTEHHTAMMRAKQDKHFSRFSGRFDTNKDGKVSLDEIKAFDPPHFKAADANGDGKLTQDEMKAAKEKHHGGMMGGGMMGEGHKSE